MNNKKKVLVVHPTRYDRSALLRKEITDQYDLVWFDESTDPLHLISHPSVGPLTIKAHPSSTLAHLRDVANMHCIDGIVSAQDYPGIIISSIVAAERNLFAPQPKLVTGFQHKVFSRQLQQEHVPAVTPSFAVIDPLALDAQLDQLFYPLFAKPVKANFSIFAHNVPNRNALRNLLTTYQLPETFTQQFDWYMKNVGLQSSAARCYIAEQVLSGLQVTLEGYAFNGHITIVGIVDSLMYPGTICFERFVYPSSLSEIVQDRMKVIAHTLMTGVGFDNGFFNIEFMYNPETDALAIIEVNPRMASQFADLYEKVDGTNTFHTLLSIGTGVQPVTKKSEGRYLVAASCVLRLFLDKRVVAIPTKDQIDQVLAEFPQSAVFIKVSPGQCLSDIEQDGKSFAYALIHLGGRDRKEIDEKLKRCKQILQFAFANV